MDKKLAKWLNHSFSTGPRAGEDYLKFQKEMKASLKKDCEANGFELHAFNGNHYEFSAVIRHEETGRFVYVGIADVRFFRNEWAEHVLVRSMAHDKDWTGGPNNYCIWEDVVDTAKRLVA